MQTYAGRNICRNCKMEFEITPDDTGFFERMKVPAPTFCPDCQMQRRMAFRNERTLHKRKETLHREEVISNYAVDVDVPIYTQKEWWGDGWDPMRYGAEYDFSRPFFQQFMELSRRVPWPALLNWNAVESDYCSYTTDNKRCYLVFGGDYNENCAYATFNFHTRDSMELYWVDKCELCYEVLYCESSYRLSYAMYCNNCSDSTFLLSCTNCHHCTGCVNLKNKFYCIFNEEYTKEEYERKLKELDLGNFAALQDFKKKFREFSLRYPVRFAEIYRSVNCTGNNVHNSKNCINCFDTYENAEDMKNVVIAGWVLKDVRNVNHAGHKSERVYDSLITFDNSQDVRFSAAISTSQDIFYSWNCRGSRNLFGCVGLTNKQNCILNRPYSKESFDELRTKIIEHMNAMPYISRSGLPYSFGEFFPPEMSLFAYNETTAQEYFPIFREEALKKGFSWRDPEEKIYTNTVSPESLPASIEDAGDDMLEKIIACKHKTAGCSHQCTSAFRVIPMELQLYKRMGIPLPHLCPNCRHSERNAMRNPMKLWHRSCMCNHAPLLKEEGSGEVAGYQNTATHSHGTNPCPNEFETSYSPGRPETCPPSGPAPSGAGRRVVYCESCYQAEVS